MIPTLDTYLQSETALPKIIVIYGPTASGKTALSLEVATHIESEIISADSRQIYRGLDIGTGKITKEEMQWISHHMIDIIDPSEAFSMVDFSNRALPLIEDLQDRGKIPVICWGTGLYIDSLLYAMALPDVEPDWKYREELEVLRQKEWNKPLWDMLHAVDPEYADELSPENYRYVMRGLEVIRDTGKSKRESKNTKIPRFSPLFLTPYTDSLENRKDLYERIDSRVEKMFDDWLVEEVWYNINLFTSHCPGLATIGYKEVSEHLSGLRTLDETIRLIQQHSRNYAKRQITWNKKYEHSNGSQ
jgi:tRNA dimethylallyltransferase